MVLNIFFVTVCIMVLSSHALLKSVVPEDEMLFYGISNKCASFLVSPERLITDNRCIKGLAVTPDINLRQIPRTHTKFETYRYSHDTIINNQMGRWVPIVFYVEPVKINEEVKLANLGTHRLYPGSDCYTVQDVYYNDTDTYNFYRLPISTNFMPCAEIEAFYSVNYGPPDGKNVCDHIAVTKITDDDAVFDKTLNPVERTIPLICSDNLGPDTFYGILSQRVVNEITNQTFTVWRLFTNHSCFIKSLTIKGDTINVPTLEPWTTKRSRPPPNAPDENVSAPVKAVAIKSNDISARTTETPSEEDRTYPPAVIQARSFASQNVITISFWFIGLYSMVCRV